MEGKKNCFGFCIGCKKPGHKIGDCKERVLNCYYCKAAGHVSRDCPELLKKKMKASCYKCGKPGHFSKTCPESQRGWNIDLDFPEVENHVVCSQPKKPPKKR